MKICLISNLYNPYTIGGAELYVERIAKHLGKENDVILITSKSFDGLRSLKPVVERQDNVKIYRFFPMNIYHIYRMKKVVDLVKPIWHLIDIWNPHSYFIIKKILIKERPDVAHTHNLGGLSLSIFSSINSLDIPHIHTLHDYALICPRATLLKQNGEICDLPNILCRGYKNIERILCNSPNVVISPSRFALDLHLKNGFFSTSRCIKLPLDIEISKVDLAQKNYDIIDLLYVGQISEHKGLHVLIKALKNLECSKIRLHIAGKGPDLSKFKQLAKLDKRIKFYGFVSGENLKDLYKQANLTIVPSICYDNSPTVIYESFRMGVPVVGSIIGGIPELIQEGYNGLLFEACNFKKLRDILCYLVEEPTKLEELSRNTIRSAKKYEISNHIKKLRKIYEEVMD